MTSYVSNQAGDRETPEVWTPNGVPGDGDTAQIQHRITNSGDWLIGDNHATDAWAIRVDNGGELINTGSITLKGNLVEYRGGNIEDTSGTLTWRPSTGNRWGKTTNGNGGTGTSTRARYINTTFAFDDTDGGDPPFINSPANGADVTGIRELDWEFTNIVCRGFGDASNRSFDIRNEGDGSVVFHSGLIDDYGQFYVRPEGTTTDTTEIRGGMSFTNPLNTSNAFLWDTGSALTTGSRILAATFSASGTTIYRVTFRSPDIELTDADGNEIILDHMDCVNDTGAATGITADGITSISTGADYGALTFAGNGGCTINNLLMCFPGDINPHYLTFSSTNNAQGDNVFNDAIFDGQGLSAAEVGDIIPQRGVTFNRILMINDAGNITLNNANTRLSVNRYTFHDAGDIRVGETAGGAEQVQLVVNGLADGQTEAILQDAAFTTQNSMVWDYNGAGTGMDTANLDHPNSFDSSVGPASVSTWKTGASYGDAEFGENDINVGDPGFVDSTRSVASWDSSLGGSGTALNAISEMIKRNGWDRSGNSATFNPDYTPSALRTYLREGFRPTNETCRGAGRPADGSPDLGAVDMAAATSLFDFYELASSLGNQDGGINQMQIAFMQSQGSLSLNQYNSLMYKFLGDLGYTGSLTDRIHQYKNS